jgi:xanthosine utilization system XapX-like protein
MNSIPAVCSKCGFTFPSPFGLANTINSAVVGCSTNCPKCGGEAYVADSFTDSQGGLHISEFFNYVRNLRDAKKLEELKSNLETADASTTATELADSLAEIEPSFAMFRNLIQAIPTEFIVMLIGLLTLIVNFQIYQLTKKNNEESLGVQRSQLELSREQFAYQKEKDKNDQTAQRQLEKEREIIGKKIADFEKKLNEVEQKSKATTKANPTRTPTLKGNSRNKPCPCGSGKKAKKCHPNGYLR